MLSSDKAKCAACGGVLEPLDPCKILYVHAMCYVEKPSAPPPAPVDRERVVEADGALVAVEVVA